MADPTPHPLFLDYEASSLLADSYPIEAGYSRPDLPEPVSFLIRPHRSWRTCAWDPAAEAVHGIPKLLLEAEGVPVEEACRRLSAAARGRAVVSDFPRVEQHWSARLFGAIGAAVPFRVASFHDHLWALAESRGVDPGEAFFVLHAHAHHFRTAHRAGPDSFRMVEIARAAVDRPYRDALFGREGYGVDWAADMAELG